MSTKTRFEEEAKGNSEMAYLKTPAFRFRVDGLENVFILKMGVFQKRWCHGYHVKSLSECSSNKKYNDQ